MIARLGYAIRGMLRPDWQRRLKGIYDALWGIFRANKRIFLYHPEMTEYFPPEDDIDKLIRRAQKANEPAECARIRNEITRIASKVSADLDIINRQLVEVRRIEQILAQSPHLSFAKEIDRLKNLCAEHEAREEKYKRSNSKLAYEKSKLDVKVIALLDEKKSITEKYIKYLDLYSKERTRKSKGTEKKEASKPPPKKRRRVTLGDAKRRALKS